MVDPIIDTKSLHGGIIDVDADGDRKPKLDSYSCRHFANL